MGKEETENAARIVKHDNEDQAGDSVKTSETNERAAVWRQKAEEARQAGDAAVEIDSLRHAAALYASLRMPAEEADEKEPIEPTNDRAHAEVCARLGERLWQQERLPEAIQAYQEATDAYGRVPAAEQNVAECAQKVREGINVLRNNPKDRLYLLIATHERRQRQYAEQLGTEKQQGDCAYQIASIFKRRERQTEAVERFEEALGLFRRAEGT
jgi:tetratricopeptide (TPR) repeat protein